MHTHPRCSHVRAGRAPAHAALGRTQRMHAEASHCLHARKVRAPAHAALGRAQLLQPRLAQALSHQCAHRALGRRRRRAAGARALELLCLRHGLRQGQRQLCMHVSGTPALQPRTAPPCLGARWPAAHGSLLAPLMLPGVSWPLEQGRMQPGHALLRLHDTGLRTAAAHQGQHKGVSGVPHTLFERLKAGGRLLAAGHIMPRRLAMLVVVFCPHGCLGRHGC